MKISTYLRHLYDLQKKDQEIQNQIRKLKKKMVRECDHKIIYASSRYWAGDPVICINCGFTVVGTNCGPLKNWPKEEYKEGMENNIVEVSSDTLESVLCNSEVTEPEYIGYE